MSIRHGYLLPTRLAVTGDTESQTALIREVVGLAENAEALGFDSVWVGDSVLAKPRLEPLSTLAGVGVATDVVELGTAVYLPNLRHPVHVAHQTATVDQLSGGRLRLGIGVGGAHQPPVREEHATLDVQFGKRGPLLDEALDIITALWTGESISYDGSFFTLTDESIGFGPCRRPPIVLGTNAFDPEKGFAKPIRERLLTHGNGWMPVQISPDRYADAIPFLDELGEKCPGEGFDHSLYLNVTIEKTESAALSKAREFLRRYYPWRDFTDEEIRNRGIFGPKEDIKERLGAYQSAGVRNVVIRFAALNQHEQLQKYRSIVRSI